MDRATQRVISVFVVVATLLFATGVVFAYFVVLPAAVEFLTNFDDSLYNIQIRASYYLSFTSMVLLASGLAFEMPIFILALVRIGVLSYGQAPPQPPHRHRADGLLRDPAARPSTRSRCSSRRSRC